MVGRPLYDRALMRKILVIHAANGVLDVRAEFLINDRLPR